MYLSVSTCQQQIMCKNTSVQFKSLFPTMDYLKDFGKSTLGRHAWYSSGLPLGVSTFHVTCLLRVQLHYLPHLPAAGHHVTQVMTSQILESLSPTLDLDSIPGSWLGCLSSSFCSHLGNQCVKDLSATFEIHTFKKF